jgi:hypothetical protein
MASSEYLSPTVADKWALTACQSFPAYTRVGIASLGLGLYFFLNLLSTTYRLKGIKLVTLKAL